MKNSKGVILIEAILALGVIVIIMTALVTALISSVNSSGFSKDQTQATSYSQEGIEVVRNFRDSSYDLFSQVPNGEYCLEDGQNTIDTAATDDCSNNVAGRFTRTIYINQGGLDQRGASSVNACADTPNSVFVASNVTWRDSRCKRGSDNCHNVELSSCFVNLYKINLN